MSGFDQILGAVEKGDFKAAANAASSSLHGEYTQLTKMASKVESSVSNLAASAHLPALRLTEAAAAVTAASVLPGGPLLAGAIALEASNPKVRTATVNIAKNMGDGMVDKIEHQPLQLVESAAIGLGTGIAIGAAAAGAVALGIVAAPEVAVGATVIGGIALAGAAIAGGIEVYKNRDAIVHNTEVMADPGAYSAKDVSNARAAFQNFGGETLNAGVGFVSSIPGAFLGGAGVSAALDAIKPAVLPVVTSLESTGSDGAMALLPKVAPDVAGGMPELPAVDLDNPAANNYEPALRQAFGSVLADAKANGSPTIIKLDTTVHMLDEGGAPSPSSQADVLYDQLKAAYPDNHFVFSKHDLNPGDPGYTEFPTPPVSADGLHISTKENPITLSGETTLPNGATLPAGTRFAVGTTYNGTEVASSMPGGKVWATAPDGRMVEVAGPGQSASIPEAAVSADPKSTGQIVQAHDSAGRPNHIIVRTAPKETDPDGQPLLDAYPSGGTDFDALFKPGTQEGFSAPKPKSAEHLLLPPNLSVEAQTNYGMSTTSGADQSYFMRSGFGDAQDATAKNYSGPTKDAQSAAELQRIRSLQGLSSGS